jgi:ribonuclease BN (tRNA processing enzyme)
MNAADLHAIPITHHRADYIYGLPIIMHEMMIKGMSESLEVYCPKPCQVGLG